MIELNPGIYRVRTLEPGGADTVEFQGGGFPAVVATGDGVENGRPAAPGQSRGGDIVLSQDPAADPGAKPLLARFALQDGDANLKGYGAPVPFYRITAAALVAASAEP